MEFKVDIKSRNDAMTGKNSVQEILEEIVVELDAGEDSGMIRDVNGNTVGNWSYLRQED
jgi:hypothetical protein